MAAASSSPVSAGIQTVKRDQVELAALFAEANPQRGRPRQRMVPPAGAKIISSRRKLRSAAQ